MLQLWVAAVGIATTLLDIRSGVRIPVEAGDFSLLQKDQPVFGAHLASYSVDTGVLSWGKSDVAWARTTLHCTCDVSSGLQTFSPQKLGFPYAQVPYKTGFTVCTYFSKVRKSIGVCVFPFSGVPRNFVREGGGFNKFS